MDYIETHIPGVWILEPKVFHDARGYFMEAYKQSDFEAHIGPTRFIQDNESCSSRGVLRGMHYQLAPYAQAKLVRVIVGTVVDMSADSASTIPPWALIGASTRQPPSSRPRKTACCPSSATQSYNSSQRCTRPTSPASAEALIFFCFFSCIKARKEDRSPPPFTLYPLPSTL